MAGSRGSVIPFFQKLLAEGAKELPITDMKMTRFWLKLEQAVEMVLEALQEKPIKAKIRRVLKAKF